jgi:FAD/FMN-containing dehydrogenase
MTIPEYDPAVTSKIEPFVYEWVSRHKGSVSAEHGLGFKKRDFISYSKSPESIAIMKKLKHLFDPKGILNPYKVLPD